MKADPNWINAVAASFTFIAAIFSTVAAIAAAITAKRAHSFQQQIEKSRHQLSKLELTLRNLQELMVTFAEVQAISESVYSDDRKQQLKEHAHELRKKITIIDSLHPEIGYNLNLWRAEKDHLGNSISQIVDYELGNIGAIVGDKYNDFFYRKSRELSVIQTMLLNEISA